MLIWHAIKHSMFLTSGSFLEITSEVDWRHTFNLESFYIANNYVKVSAQISLKNGSATGTT